MEHTVRISAKPLKLNLKTTVQHAAASRNRGESIWVCAERNGRQGFGEGCPRSYSAGDTLDSSLSWTNAVFVSGQTAFKTIDDVNQWIQTRTEQIDTYPSAWCAVEMALLDLFSQEKGCMVETLAGLKNPRLKSTYTAVLGDDKPWRYAYLAERYLIRGLTDFKIKLSGDFERDCSKIETLKTLAAKTGTDTLRIRLDANNLWKNQKETAVSFIRALPEGIYAVEEPVGADMPEDSDYFAAYTGLPVILDESLCTSDDLDRFRQLTGPFIANIKVSRVGGILRAVHMINKIKTAGWPVIIGCHVGETSLLSRAGLIAAAAAGDHLDAHEGAFGDYLVSREPVSPMLRFSRRGRLDLTRPYYYIRESGMQVILPSHWEKGLGMTCRSSVSIDESTSSIETLPAADKYLLHCRAWKSSTARDAVLILHGGMSHSGWQAPLAESIRRLSGHITVIASDRRGCGLNAQKGDLGRLDLLIDDIVRHVRHLKKRYKRVHLAGWCQGAQFAIVAAGRLQKSLSSLILLTPGLFWNDRFRSILRITEKTVWQMVSHFKLAPARGQACIPVPMEPFDFTDCPQWMDFIEQDPLKTTGLTLGSVCLMDEIQELSWTRIFQIHLPILTILAENDRIVDNVKVRQFLELVPDGTMHLHTLNTGHAIQFEQPDQAADHIVRFIQSQTSGDLCRPR